MKKIVAAAVVAAVLAGCSQGQAATPKPTPTHDDHSFLSDYIDYLTGKKPWPEDSACQPKDLHDLLIPCEEGKR